MGLISQSVERLEESLSLLGEIMATFEVNKGRLEWTGDEMRKLYELYDGWRRRYRDINGCDQKGGAS